MIFFFKNTYIWEILRFLKFFEKKACNLENSVVL